MLQSYPNTSLNPQNSDPARLIRGKPRAGVTHRCPPLGSGVMPCCGRTPFEVPDSDRLTKEPALVTCVPDEVPL